MQKAVHETGLCLSTVQFIWKTSDRQFKIFQEYAGAYLYQELLRQGLIKNQIKLLIKLSRKKFLRKQASSFCR